MGVALGFAFAWTDEGVRRSMFRARTPGTAHSGQNRAWVGHPPAVV